MEKGKGKWARIIIMHYMCIFWLLPVSMKLKEEARQVNQKFFEFYKGEYRDGQHA